MNDNSIAARRERMKLWMPVLVRLKEEPGKEQMCPVCGAGKLKVERKKTEAGEVMQMTCSANPAHSNSFMAF